MVITFSRECIPFPSLNFNQEVLIERKTMKDLTTYYFKDSQRGYWKVILTPLDIVDVKGFQDREWEYTIQSVECGEYKAGDDCLTGTFIGQYEDIPKLEEILLDYIQNLQSRMWNMDNDCIREKY